MMALDAGDQTAGSMLRGLELLMKGELNPAANQFGVALRNAPDAPIASFYLGACYAAAGRDKEAVSAWERARAAKLQLPALQVILADGWLRLGQPADALEPLREALESPAAERRHPTESRHCAVAPRAARAGLSDDRPVPREKSDRRRRADGCAARAVSGARRRKDDRIGGRGQGTGRRLRARVRGCEGTAVRRSSRSGRSS